MIQSTINFFNQLGYLFFTFSKVNVKSKGVGSQATLLKDSIELNIIGISERVGKVKGQAKNLLRVEYGYLVSGLSFRAVAHNRLLRLSMPWTPAVVMGELACS